MNYYSICLSKFADFSGRARRREYWTFAIVNCLIALLLLILGLAFGEDSPASNILVTIFYLIMLVPNLSVSVRRLHDIGKSGWHMFLSLIPLIGDGVLVAIALLPALLASTGHDAVFLIRKMKENLEEPLTLDTAIIDETLKNNSKQ